MERHLQFPQRLCVNAPEGFVSISTESNHIDSVKTEEDCVNAPEGFVSISTKTIGRRY